MILRFEYRRYRLAFRGPVNTAHGPWREREGVIVRLQDEAGGVGWGEAAPIPWFGMERADEVAEVAAGLGEWGDEGRLRAVPSRLASLQHALVEARGEIERRRLGEAESAGEKENAFRQVAALLPAGKAALAALPPKADAGFRVFKWKVGVRDLGDELVLLDELCGALPEGAKLRLDANGAWDRRQAERWLERCAERPVEFVEQPCWAGEHASDTERRRTDDVLRGLAEDFPTPIALDEAIVSDGDAARWIEAGWPGLYVVKPALLADLDGTLAALAKAQADVVFSSALETAVGARAALRAAWGWRGPRRALGFGVWPLFADTRCDGPAAAPFIRLEDWQRIDPEAVWNVLS